MSKATKRLFGFGAIIGGILVIILGVTQPNPFRSTTSYFAEFDNVHGLGAIGRDIRVAGRNVGDIGKVEAEADRAVIELRLWEEIPVKTDALVDMRPHTLFEGSSFVDLFPGSPSADPLPDGGLIPNEQTTNYVTLDEALRILRPEIRESLADLAGVGRKTLDHPRTIAAVQRTLAEAPALFRALAGPLDGQRRLLGPIRALQGTEGDELSGTIRGMSETVEAVATQEEELIPLARRLNRTAAALAVDGGRPLDATLQVLPGALRELRAGAPSLITLIDRLDRFAAELAPAVPELTAAVREATPLLARSIPVLERTTPLIRQLRTIARRQTAVTPALADLVESLDPLTDIFGGSILPVLLQDSLHGAPTYRQLAALFTAADAVWRPYQTPSHDPGGQGGHLWNLGLYIDPEAFAGLFNPGGSLSLTASACAGIEELNRDLARTLTSRGGCR